MAYIKLISFSMRRRASSLRPGGFSAGLLRHWAWRLGLTRKRRKPEPASKREQPIRLARVVVPAQRRPRIAAGARDGIEVEVGLARVHVRPDFDAETLTAVLDVLERRSARREERR